MESKDRDRCRELIHLRLCPMLSAYVEFFHRHTPAEVRDEACINAFVELFRDAEPLLELSNRTIYELSEDEFADAGQDEFEDASVIYRLIPRLRSKVDGFIGGEQELNLQTELFEPTIHENDLAANVQTLLDACDQINPTFRFIVWRHCFEKEPIDMIATSFGLPQDDLRRELAEVRRKLRLAILNRYPSHD